MNTNRTTTIRATNVTRRTFLKSSVAISALAFGGVPVHLLGEERSADVIVLGAGLAGLYAAMKLEAEGKSVIVLEASDRPGGRLYTLPEEVGKSLGVKLGDTGGVEVGDNYKRLLTLAQKLGVVVEDPPREAPPEVCLNIGGALIQASDWEASPLNQLASAEKKLLPMRLESALMMPHNPLKTLDDWYKPEFAAFDVATTDFLRSKGVSDEALRLMNVASNTNDLATTSALNVFRSLTFRTASGATKTMRIAGGSSRLPEAMAKALKRPVQYGKRAASIERSADRVTIGCADGTRYVGASCVCALPIPALRRVVIAPALTGAHAEALQSLPYTAITQIYLAPKKEFWREDGFAATMWTDSPLERVFALQRDGRVAYFTIWLNGIGAQKADSMRLVDLKAFVLSEMARLRPSSKGALEIAHVHSWALNPFAGGAYFHLAPGQASRLFPAISEPAGQLFFAGEHLGLQNNGMEAALESAEHAVARILRG
jgi:monoamine oxidase